MIARRSQLRLYTVQCYNHQSGSVLVFSGTAKNNAIKALLSDYVPSEPGNAGMQ